jgi:hypothetical protein
LEALTALKENGIYDQFVYAHELFYQFNHGLPEFLPWHR